MSILTRRVIEEWSETMRRKKRSIALFLITAMLASNMQGGSILVSAEVENDLKGTDLINETVTSSAIETSTGTAVTATPEATTKPNADQNSTSVSGSAVTTEWSDIVDKLPKNAEYYYHKGTEEDYWWNLEVCQPCGPTAWWYYDEAEETIVFTGEGEMDWYSVSNQNAPGTYTLAQQGKTIKHAIVTGGVTELGNDMLYGMSELEDVILSDEVTELEDAFSGCTSLRSITIGKNVKYIDANVFRDCKQLEEVMISPDNPYYCIENNTLFNKDKTKIILAWGENCVVSSNVLSIDPNAFLSEKVESIWVDNRNTEFSSENGVLYAKDKSVMYRCPKGKSGTVVIPDEVLAVSSSALKGCSKIEKLCIGEKMDTGDIEEPAIYEYTLDDCKSLKEIVVASGNALYTSEDGVMYNKNKTKLYMYPKGRQGFYTMPDNITAIRTEVFVNCKGLTGISVGKQVNKILDFTGCENLEDVQMAESCKSYSSSDGMIFDKEKTTLLFCAPGKQGACIVPDTVEEVKLNCFKECKKITSLSINTKVLDIGLQDCDSLESLNLGKNVTDDEDLWQYFRGKSLKTINVDEENADFSSKGGILYNKKKTQLIACPSGTTGKVTIPNTVKTLRTYSFADCTEVTAVTFSTKLTKVGVKAFSGCTGLTSVSLPSKTKDIMDGAFDYCTNLKKIVIPAKVATIDWTLFRCCKSLKNIKVASKNEKYCSVDGIVYNKKKTEVVFCGEGKSGKITMPSTVTTIGESAYYYCTKITGITFSKKVNQIKPAAFWGCSGLTSISLPSKLTYVESGTFNACYKLKKVTFPSTIKTIDSMSFNGCYRLKTVTIPKKVTIIDDSAFEKCITLNKVTIKSTVLKELGEGAFSLCPSLENMTLPSSVKTIGKYAFSGCTALTKINIPSKVTSLSDGVFSNCISLTTLVIPKKVTTFGASCFDGCSALKKVKIKGTVLKKVGNYVFYGMPENAVFVVPKAKKSAYKKMFASKDTYGFKNTMSFKTF